MKITTKTIHELRVGDMIVDLGKTKTVTSIRKVDNIWWIWSDDKSIRSFCYLTNLKVVVK